MKTFILNNKGELREENLKRENLSKIFSLHIRDLRPVFSLLQVSTILPREKALIINLGFLKVILSEEEAYFLTHHKHENLDNFLIKISEKIKKEKIENFYLFVFEKILEAKANQMSKKINVIDKNIEELLPKIQKNFSENNLEKMLFIKKRVFKLETRLNEIISAVKEILEDEENFDELAKLSKSKDRDSEIESILENFIEQIEDYLGHIFRAKEELEDTDQYINLKLSSQRTTVVKFDLLATSITLIFSFLAVLVGLYGVNLKNGFEDSNKAFYILASFLILSFIFLSSLFI